MVQVAIPALLTAGRAVIVPAARWQRTAVAAILVIPLLAVILLSTPAWVAWPFLNADRRTAILDFLNQLVEWVRAAAGPEQ
jgi:hypothetical protein